MNVLITGATGGLGEALVKQFASCGHNIFITGRSKKKLSDLEDFIKRRYNTQIKSFPCDLKKDKEIEKLIDVCSRWNGGIQCLINSAAIFDVKAIEEVTIQDFDDCFALNVRAPFILSNLLFSKGNLKQIINIGSSSAYAGFKNTTLYCASKHALLGLSRSLYEEYKDSDVKVYCFSPGSIQTEMGRKVPNQDYETFLDPYEIAEYIHNSTQRETNFITQEVRINRYHVR